MESAVCIDQTKRAYFLARGVRARKEAFGLLFYSSKNAKLTFIRSGGLLDVAPDPENGFRLLSRGRDAALSEKVERLLQTLLQRGLVFEK
jgi:putative mycofactocin binding protein MftB